MNDDNIDTTKLMIGFAIAFGALLTSAVGFLLGFYATGKNTSVAIIGWSLAVFGFLEALFTKKIVELLFTIRRKGGVDPEV